MVKILVKKFDKYIKLPVYKTSGSSGIDLMAHVKNKINIKPGNTAIVPTGLSVAIPKNYEIQIRPRSGLAAKKSITVLNTPGTVDSDYRGELKVILGNLGEKEEVIDHGERVAQIVLAPVYRAVFTEVKTDLTQTERGVGGFGSTGRR